MNLPNRREVFGMLSAAALMGTSAYAQGNQSPTSAGVKIFKYDEVPVTHTPTGAAARNIPQDLIPAGDVSGVHLTTIEPGKEFGPMRKSSTCEIRLIFSGTIEVLSEDQPPRTAGPGDMIIAPVNQTYKVRNPSNDMPLSYFILQIKPKA